MAKPINAYIKNAIAQLFDEIEDKCHVKFATFTASDIQGQKEIVASTRDYMEDKPYNGNDGIYKYLYDPGLSFDFRFHQRLAAAPFEKTNKPWATIMFSTKQVRTLTNILSHVYKNTIPTENGVIRFKERMVSVPVNMVVISNDMDKLYNTTEKIAMYFDRFINFHYTHVLDFGEMGEDLEVCEEVVGRAANIREVDLDKLDTEHKGSLCSQAYQFDLVYWIAQTPGVSLKLLEKIILEIEVNGQKPRQIITITEDGIDYGSGN